MMKPPCLITRKDILPPPARGQTSYIPGITPSESDTVVAIKHSILVVCWMAINQKVSPL